MAALREQVEELKRRMPASWIAGFPGQASQFVGMGKSLYERYGFLRELFELAEDITRINLRKLCFEGPDEELTKTVNAQPSIVLVSLATLEALRAELEVEDLRDMGLVAVTGHSLGEITALMAAGSLPFEEGFRLVKERALAMEEAASETSGAMLAVISKREPLDEKRLEELVASIRDRGEVLVLANYNSPFQIIASGTASALNELKAKLREHGMRGIPLKVSGAFHSPLMRKAEERLRSFLESLHIKPPRYQLLSPTYLRAVQIPEEIAHLIPAQMTSPVKWTQLVRTFPEVGTLFVEIGPKDVLFKLVRAISEHYDLSLEALKIGD